MSEKTETKKEEEKFIYYRIRNTDGTETSDVIPESRYNKLLQNYEEVETIGNCVYLQAK